MEKRQSNGRIYRFMILAMMARNLCLIYCGGEEVIRRKIRRYQDKAGKKWMIIWDERNKNALTAQKSGLIWLLVQKSMYGVKKRLTSSESICSMVLGSVFHKLRGGGNQGLHQRLVKLDRRCMIMMG